ncbi:26S proteasome non-ATPase regulatory subunit 6 [Cichlidogyrus casuarinus]|uniref:26S proteasome non-ATPase regulatory subunit 6 n=1 Tax=Cichlidogyrus casuarinus TaxID=1844966 RepID=A0ABD2PRQ1_9PLAT
MPAENFETEGLEKIPDLRIAQWCFELELKDSPTPKDVVLEKIMTEIKSHEMSAFYEYFGKRYSHPIDQKLLKQMQTENKKQIQELDQKIKEAEENQGDTEVRQFMIEKAHYYSKIGDKDAAIKDFKQILEKTLMPGARLDCIFHLIRIGFFWNDCDLITEYIDKASKIIEEGGDWDRRNRLKVYRGLYAMSIRDFETASKYFMDAVATFTSYELMDYQTFICYAVLSAMITLKRPDLREKVSQIILVHVSEQSNHVWFM